jgi:epoxyqueuosine reductase
LQWNRLKKDVSTRSKKSFFWNRFWKMEEWMAFREDIKEFALDLGFSEAGITHAEPFYEYIDELKSRYEMYSWFIEGRQLLKGAEPKSLMPEAKSIVVVVQDFCKKSFPEELLGKIGRLYQARAYSAPPYRLNGARRQLLKEFLEKNGCKVLADPVIPARLSAARAGVATYGRNTFAFAKGIGSFIVISTFLVDKELEDDEPTKEVKCPPKCTACMDACPTKAIYEPLRINPFRCIAFNTFTTQDGRTGGVSSYIPPDIREKMGSWIHGCDICQEVCPRNEKKLKANLPPDEYLAKIARDFDLNKLLKLPDEFFTKSVQPLMYNYISEKKYFQRNAAIAMGNTGDTAFVPALGQAMQEAEGLLRSYAAWALGKIGGSQAKQILELSLTRETLEPAKKEIEAALAAV